MSLDSSVLTLSFLDDGVEKGRMSLSVGGGPLEEFPVPEHPPAFIRADLSEGVMFINDLSGVNGEVPFQVYTGCDSSLSPILLLENTVYEISLASEGESSFDYLRENSGEISLRKLHFQGEGGEELYILQFRSYVGKGYFDITVDGRRLEIPFEVRSRKIGYLTDYPQMLSDIAEFSASLLMSVRSPLHTCYDLSDHGSGAAYEDFIVLDYLFSKLDLAGMYRYVRENRQMELVSFTERMPSGVVANVDPSDLSSLVIGDNLLAMDGGPIAGCYAPSEAPERIWEDSLDTPENRLVKDLVLTVDSMVRSLLDSDQSSGSDYVRTRLLEMRELSDAMARDQWLADVGELDVVPYDSNVLQSRYGYADLFHMYQILGLGAAFRQEDAESILSGQNKKLHLVYEYWCYTRLFVCLSGMSENVLALPMKSSNGRWTISISNNKTKFRIIVDGTELLVDLYYNRGFSAVSEGFRSYSVKLRPDFTLVVRPSSSQERLFIVNFDAKYRSKPLSDDVDVESDDVGTDSWEYDICKMHTYRDALIHSCGSYVLYPGSRYKVYRKPWDQRAWELRDESYIPSVGAIPLIPGDNNMRELNSAISQILERIVSISESDPLVRDVRDYLF